MMRLVVARIVVNVVAAVGSIGQAILLFHSLADCYPYKMMTTPSYRFYEVVAYVGLVVAPAVSALASSWLSRRGLWYVPAVACALSPAVFLGILAAAYVIAGVDMANVANFDHTTPLAALAEFNNQALWLIAVGSVTGTVCGGLISILTVRPVRPIVTSLNDPGHD